MRAIMAGLLMLWSPSAFATCGFDTCPAVDLHSKEGDGGLAVTLPLYIRATDLVDESAVATQAFVGVMARLGSEWAVQGSVPLTVVTLDEEPSRFGMGNALAMVEWLPQVTTWMAIGPGMQIELPTGSTELGDTHGVGLGYVTALLKGEVPFLLVRTGLGHTFGAGPEEGHAHDHGGHEDTSVAIAIEPHASQEWLLRTGFGGSFAADTVVPMLFADLHRALAGEAPGSTTVSVGGTVRFRVDERIELDAMAQVPVGSERRFDWRSGLAVAFAL